MMDWTWLYCDKPITCMTVTSISIIFTEVYMVLIMQLLHRKSVHSTKFSTHVWFWTSLHQHCYLLTSSDSVLLWFVSSYPIILFLWMLRAEITLETFLLFRCDLFVQGQFKIKFTLVLVNEMPCNLIINFDILYCLFLRTAEGSLIINDL